jgi:dTDP-4-dehydrorhamnose 3,5-epimerase
MSGSEPPSTRFAAAPFSEPAQRTALAMPMPVEFTTTEIAGVLVVKTGRVDDERGFFSESYSLPVWKAAGFSPLFVQDNLSRSRRGTVRGMHYQLSARGMGKLVRVVHGAVFDVAVDLRRGSPSFGKWVGRELSADNGLSLWVPPGFAHGFVALEDEALVLYKCTDSHAPEAERALHYNDPTVAVKWPIEPTIVSTKDEQAPYLAAAEYDFVYAD